MEKIRIGDPLRHPRSATLPTSTNVNIIQGNSRVCKSEQFSLINSLNRFEEGQNIQIVI
jgi:hypothetical protein